jgi:hypothetical protein
MQMRLHVILIVIIIIVKLHPKVIFYGSNIDCTRHLSTGSMNGGTGI